MGAFYRATLDEFLEGLQIEFHATSRAWRTVLLISKPASGSASPRPSPPRWQRKRKQISSWGPGVQVPREGNQNELVKVATENIYGLRRIVS
jgi:hypothetical protein